MRSIDRLVARDVRRHDSRVLDTLRYFALEFDCLMRKMVEQRMKPSDLPEAGA